MYTVLYIFYIVIFPWMLRLNAAMNNKYDFNSECLVECLSNKTDWKPFVCFELITPHLCYLISVPQWTHFRLQRAANWNGVKNKWCANYTTLLNITAFARNIYITDKKRKHTNKKQASKHQVNTWMNEWIYQKTNIR